MQKRLEWPLLVAALLTIPAIAIEQSDLGEPWDTVAVYLNWTIWLAFWARRRCDVESPTAYATRDAA